MHSIQIPDKLWDLYEGSPQKMRDTLWQVAFDSYEPEPEITVPLIAEVDLDQGTEITLQFKAKCSNCGQAMYPGTQAIIRTRGDKKEFLHAPHCPS